MQRTRTLFFFIFHLQGVWWQMCRVLSPIPRATWRPPRCCGPLICTHSSRTRCVASMIACACVWVFFFFLFFFESSQRNDSDRKKKREKTWMFRTCVAGVYKTCHTTDAGILLGLGSVSYWRLHFVFISSAQGIFFFSSFSHLFISMVVNSHSEKNFLTSGNSLTCFAFPLSTNTDILTLFIRR